MQVERQSWHKDAKWVCALLLLAVIIVTLPLVSLYRLTSKGPATKTLSYTMAGLTSPEGIDSTSGIEDIKQEVAKKGSKTIYLSGLPVIFTKKDVNTLSPRQLRLKVFGAFADRFWEQGASGLVKSQGLDKASAEKFKKDSSMISLFTKSVHQRLAKFVFGLVFIGLALSALLVFFSNRFGKLVSLGSVLLLAGLPAIILVAAASSHPEVSGAARSDSTTYTSAIASAFTSFVAPLVLPVFSSTYLAVFLSGLILLGAGGAGLLIYRFTRMQKSKSKEGQTNSLKATKDT